MSEQLNHLVFYDGNCGLCDRIVQFVLEKDKNKQFVFASLQGETAAQYLKNLPPEIRYTDSLILIENYLSNYPRVYILSKGALKIAWLLGAFWKLLGIFSFFPNWMFDWIYRLIAEHRHQIFSNDECFIPISKQSDRFLP